MRKIQLFRSVFFAWAATCFLFEQSPFAHFLSQPPSSSETESLETALPTLA
jgi:hypothetical protein